MSTDINWLSMVARLEVIIQINGIHRTFEGLLQAVENIEEEMIKEIPDFEDSQHHKNIMHQKQIIELTMNACDLDDIYGSAEARKVAMERFKDNMKIEVAV